RMLRVNYAYSQDDGSDFSWTPVLKIFTSDFEEHIDTKESNGREILNYLVLEKNNPNSVLNIISKARENARSVQDNVTKELWQCLNDFYHMVREDQLKHTLELDDPISVLDNLVKQVM